MRQFFLGTTALIGLSFATPAAFAACTPTPNPPDGGVVTCTGVSTTQITGSQFGVNVTVNIQNGAQLNVNSGNAISLDAGARVTLNGTGAINTTGNNNRGVFGGDNSQVSMGAGSSISTTGNIAHGIWLSGFLQQVTLNGASISTQGSGSHGILFSAAGAAPANQITLNGASSISTAGNGSSAISVGGVADVVLNGGSQLTASGGNAYGVYLGGLSTLTMNGTSTIHTSGGAGHGIVIKGSPGFGSTATIGSSAGVFASGAGANAVDMVGADNTLINHGTLQSSQAAAIQGDNNDQTVFNDGPIAGLAGQAINLGGGNDQLTLDTGSFINGTVDGGAGTDTVTLQGTGSMSYAFQNFEHLIMNGTRWDLNTASSSFANDVVINSGRLDVNGTLTSPVITVNANGELAGAGTVVGNVNSTGLIAAGNPGDTTTSTLHITGNLTQTGGGFIFKFDNAGFDQVNATGTITLNNAPSVTFAAIPGATGATGVILHAGGGITGSLGAVGFVGNGAATLTQTANDISVNAQSLALQSVDGTAFAANAYAASETGVDMLDTVGEEQLAGLDDCGSDRCAVPGPDRRHVWGKGFGRFAKEGAADGNQGFDYRIAGGGIGADFRVADGLRLGVAGLYGNTEETVDQHAADSDINTALAALYANYQHGRFFLTGAVTGGWQSFDLTRSVLNSTQGVDGRGNPITITSKDDVDGSTDGWLVGANLQTGMRFQFPNNWHLTPSLGASYQHQWINGYKEHGNGAVSVASEQADALRLKAQLELAQDYQTNDAVITPHLRLGVRQQYNFGGAADGAFANGTDFSLELKDGSRTVGLAGVGVQVAFNNGLATYVDYDGALASGRTVHAVTGGLRYSW
jgi:uncharacterized protein with beta-barrel porin domain